ncbi:MAG: dihydroneopterin aldolase [Planctomycetota bacterium]
MIFRIKNLRLATIIGINDWEREHEQEIIINIEAEFDGEKGASSDDIRDTVNYRDITKDVIELVEQSACGLLETLAAEIRDLVMEDKRVERVAVEIDKPRALRFADSVSITCTGKRET